MGLQRALSGPFRPLGPPRGIDAVLVLATKMARPAAHGSAHNGTGRHDPDSDDHDLDQVHPSAAQARIGPTLADPSVVALIDRLSRENVELAGRVGWLQSELQQTRARLESAEREIRLLSTPTINGLESDDTETGSPPATSANGPNSGAECPPRRPWWRFWRWLET